MAEPVQSPVCVLLLGIPRAWKTEDLRHFFTNAVEAGWFQLFHYKARNVPFEGLTTRPPVPPTAAGDGNSCVLRIKPDHEQDVRQRYHNKRVRGVARSEARLCFDNRFSLFFRSGWTPRGRICPGVVCL